MSVKGHRIQPFEPVSVKRCKHPPNESQRQRDALKSNGANWALRLLAQAVLTVFLLSNEEEQHD